MKIFQLFLNVCLLSLTTHSVLQAQNKGQLEIQLPPAFDDLAKEGMKAMQKNGISGYRLQLFTGKKSEADLIRKKFMDAYPDVGAYIVFEIPNYKLHVGDFRLKIEAEGFREKISEEFRGAFVLSTTIVPFLSKVD
jgi:hypothetical protein